LLVQKSAIDPWRSGLGALLWMLACFPMLAIGDPSLDSLIACSRLTSGTERLACFDREMAEISKSNSQPTSAGALTAEQRFGLSDKQASDLKTATAEAPAPSALHARIASVSQSPSQRQMFVLDNAQSWQQIELDPDFDVHVGQMVRISKGALGSFWLSTDSHRATRIKRIR
jgi:hypothetical protein